MWSAAPRALAMWGRRQWLAAAVVAAGVGLLVGISTVLIPNGWFSREIATTGWDYPVWVVMAALTGLLAATYVAPVSGAASSGPAEARRPARFGTAGAVLGWFAVGCPVCNKIALFALGYTGALQWFAPAQPILAAAAIALSGAALLVRLRGQVWCPTGAART
ncbi:hypothetical protein GCG21_12780 [Pseudactinotalea sp. HY160]|nr:hypothetical protein [Pseudactinotalea sp. HY160]